MSKKQRLASHDRDVPEKAEKPAWKSWSWIAKVAAGAFATIVAPVIAGLIVKLLEPGAPPAARIAGGEPKVAVAPAMPTPSAAEASPAVAPAKAHADHFPEGWKDADFRPMFNGRDLHGWVAGESELTGWTVDAENQVLSRTATKADPDSRTHWAFTERSFADFRMRLEFRVEPNSDGAIALRARPPFNNTSGARIEIPLVNDLANPISTGTVMGVPSGIDHFTPPKIAMPVRPREQWNSLELEFVGQRLQIAINGQKMQDLRVEENVTARKKARKDVRRPAGRIGLQCRKGQVAFRNIEIHELASSNGD